MFQHRSTQQSHARSWWERTNWQCAWSFFWRWYALLILFYSINALQCQALKVYSNMCCSHTSSVLCMQSTQQLKVHIRIVALVIANAWDIAPAYHSFSFNVLANYAHAALQDKRRDHIRSTFIKSMQQIFLMIWLIISICKWFYSIWDPFDYKITNFSLHLCLFAFWWRAYFRFQKENPSLLVERWVWPQLDIELPVVKALGCI